MYTATDRRFRKDNLDDGGKGWAVLDGSGTVVEHAAVARVVIVEAERRETIVKPGALLDITFTRRFVEKDPGENILLEDPYDVRAIDSAVIHKGFCFMRHEDQPVFFDMADVGVPGHRWPQYQRHLLPVVLARRNGDMIGQQISAAEFLSKAIAFKAADVAEAFEKQEPILEAVRNMIASEVLQAVKAKAATVRFEALKDLAASDLLPGFIEDHLAAGFVLDLLAESLADSVPTMGFGEMLKLANLVVSE